MDFWKSLTEASEKAKEVARAVSKKGMEFAETATEEAGKKLKDLGLHEKPPSPEELEYFGITGEFQEFIRTLNYSTFRDFPPEHLAPLSPGAAAGVAGDQQLNPWQAQHARLVCQVVKEVNELRFVLCPRYMTDEHFWHVYFTLVKKYLPDKAFTWTETDTLPTYASGGDGSGDIFALASGLGSQLKSLGSRLQQSSRNLGAGGLAGLEMSSLGGPSAAAGSSSGGGGGAAAGASGGGAGEGGAGGSAAAPAPKEEAGVLEADPDLEAYLQVAINEEKEGGSGEEGYEVGEDDLDLDSYINELSAEVEAADNEEEEGK